VDTKCRANGFGADEGADGRGQGPFAPPQPPSGRCGSCRTLGRQEEQGSQDALGSQAIEASAPGAVESLVGRVFDIAVEALVGLRSCRAIRRCERTGSSGTWHQPQAGC
jgi:hypothetical protein